jgi:hypothetical protein
VGSQQQAQLLWEQKFSEVDWPNLIEEIEDLGRSEYCALISAIDQLTLPLLKWQYQPERRSPSWRHVIDKPRIQIECILANSLGLKSCIPEALTKGYKYGRKGAIKETFLSEMQFPQLCPYSWDVLVDENFYPEASCP